MKAIAALALVTLTGCATQQQEWHWAKAGAGNQEFSMDAGQCRAQSFAVPGVSLLQAALVYDGCMHGKGWQKTASVQAQTRPAPLTYYPNSTQHVIKGCDLLTDSNGTQRLSCPPQ